jgi:hypothetical protein
MADVRPSERDGALKQLFEGGAATMPRLASASGLSVAHLERLAAREKWRPAAEGKVLKDRLASLSRRIVDLLDEPDEEVLLGKQRLDAISALLRAADRLKELIDAGETGGADAELGEGLILDTFASIDKRIEQLAHAYAERLVETKPVAGTSASGEQGMVAAGTGGTTSAER